METLLGHAAGNGGYGQGFTYRSGGPLLLGGNECIAPTTTETGSGPVRCRERLGGVLRFYYRAAA